MTDFGGKLRQARERRGISLGRISGTTKISVAALESLERNDPSRLPGGIFTRALVRSYASEVGLDPDVTLREFLTRFDLDAGPVTLEALATASSSQRVDRSPSGVFFKIIVASLLLAAIVLYLALVKNPDKESAVSPHDQARRTSQSGLLALPETLNDYRLKV